MQRRLLLDVVVAERAALLELLAREDEALLIGRDTFLLLDLRLHVLDRVVGLDLERDRLAGQRLDEDLHGAGKGVFDLKDEANLQTADEAQAAAIHNRRGAGSKLQWQPQHCRRKP